MARKNILLVLFCLVVMLCGCGKAKPVEVISYYQDDRLMEHYGNTYTSYGSVEYEQITVEWQDASGRESFVGPYEPKYRGIIYLSTEQAGLLMKSYEWSEATPQIVFDSIKYDISDSNIWYTSKDFENDLFTKVAINYVSFNGTDAIIFEIQVM